MPINKFESFNKKFMVNSPDTKIHEATGKIKQWGEINKMVAGATPKAAFRQVGKSPYDKSGYKVKHLGDKKK